MNDDLEKKFEAVRARFPHTGKIVYFNAASNGPFSLDVMNAVEENMKVRAAAEIDDTPTGFNSAEELRAAYAGLIGASKDDIGLGLNTSFGLNVVAFGLPLPQGSEILVSDIEFPSIVYAWRAAAERFGYKLKFIKSKDMAFDIDAFREAITDKARVLCLSYVQFFNGYKNDLATIVKICRENNLLFVVDGIQGMGTEPVNVKELGIDVFTSGCQKWLLSPQGCSFFYIAPNVREKLTVPFMSWLSVDWKMNFTSLFKYDNPYYDAVRKYELGYYVVLNLVGMKAAVKYFQQLGIENIREHNHRLLDRLAGYLRGNDYYRITSSMEEKHRSSILTFTCDRLKELYGKITLSKIILAQREGSIRVSAHLYNNEADIDRLIEVLDRFAAEV
jgi:cysteine desulfurase/selenocysteine lyase